MNNYFELAFNLDKFETEIDKMSAVLQWIVNRAFEFDKQKFHNICLHINDDSVGMIAYNICLAIGTFSNVKFYVPRKELRKCRFYGRNNIVIKCGKRKWNKILNSLDTMVWDATTTCSDNEQNSSLPQIFYGISRETLTKIAVLLYDWNGDRKLYLKSKKQKNKEVKQMIKEYKMEAKLMKKEHKR